MSETRVWIVGGIILMREDWIT